MSRIHRIALGVAALVSAPVLAHAQAASDAYNPSRFAVEPYLSQAWQKNDVATSGGDNGYNSTGGFGVRVMFGQSSVSRAMSSVFNRARAGAFLTYASADGGVKQYNYGLQGDFPLFVTPATAGFRLDPFVSLALGAVHTSVDAGGGTNLTSNDFALTPAVGTLIPITGEVKFRGDLRDALVFGDKTRNNFIAEGGISIGF